MEIRHLKYFVAVAEELHFSRAAERLNISQPPLSQQINQLEEEIGFTLFIRTKRQVALTDAGKIFLDRVYYIFHQLDKACEEARKVHQGEVGQLRIQFTGIMSKQVTEFLQEYRSRFPGIDFQIQLAPSTSIIDNLKEKSIHIGFVAQTVDSDILDSIVTHRLKFFVALPENHPLAHGTAPIDLRELKDEPFVMQPRKIESYYYDTIISICRHFGFSPKIHQEAEGVFSTLTLVSAGWGVTLVTALVKEFQKEGVVFREIKDNPIQIDYSVAWSKDEDSPIVNTFTTFLKEFFI